MVSMTTFTEAVFFLTKTAQQIETLLKRHHSLTKEASFLYQSAFFQVQVRQNSLQSDRWPGEGQRVVDCNDDDNDNNNDTIATTTTTTTTTTTITITNTTTTNNDNNINDNNNDNINNDKNDNRLRGLGSSGGRLVCGNKCYRRGLLLLV